MVLVLGRDDFTYKVKNSQQVLINKKNEKRAFTCITLVTRIEEVFAIKIYGIKKLSSQNLH